MHCAMLAPVSTRCREFGISGRCRRCDLILEVAATAVSKEVGTGIVQLHEAAEMDTFEVVQLAHDKWDCRSNTMA